MKNKKGKILSCLILTVSLFFNPLQAIKKNIVHTTYGTHRVMGKRDYQEDTYYNSNDGRFFGVFDGHGGDETSKILENEFYSTFRSQKNPQKIWRWIWKWI